MQTEMPALLVRSGNPMIDGIELDHIRRLGAEAGTNAILAEAHAQTFLSHLSSSNLDRYRSFTPNDVVEQLSLVDNLGAFSTWLNEALPEQQARFRAGVQAMQEAAIAASNNGVARGLNRIGIVGGALALVVSGTAAAAEHQRGNTERAREIMEEYAAETIGSELGSIAGGALATIALGIAAVAGAAVTVPVAGAVVLGGTLVGGFFGAEGAAALYELAHDRDVNGRIDLVDRLRNLFFGATATIITPLPADLDGGRFTIDATLSREAIVEQARTSIAWRYALRELNSFVVTDADYSRHNTDGSLDLYDEATGTGTMTPKFLADRAAMLAWKIRYETRGARDDNDGVRTGPKPYNEEWDTLEVNGNWDFVDLTVRLGGGEPLTLEIDGAGLSLDDHQVVFGRSADDSINGAGEADSLYGMGGNDILNGRGGNDWLEGQLGNDTLDGGAGDDTLLGGAGADVYRVAAGSGMDTVIDSDGQGHIELAGRTLTGAGEVQSDAAENVVWVDRSNASNPLTYRLDRASRTLIVTGHGSNVVVRQFDAGDLGIVVPAAPVAPPPVAAELHFDTSTSAAAQAAADHLFSHSASTEHIVNGYALNFTLDLKGGDDVFEGGASGTTALELSAIAGGAGNDQLYVTTRRTQAQALAALEVTESAWRGESLLDAGWGDDTVHGSAGDDIVFGGQGHDQIVTGAGGDMVFSDGDAGELHTLYNAQGPNLPDVDERRFLQGGNEFSGAQFAQRGLTGAGYFTGGVRDQDGHAILLGTGPVYQGPLAWMANVSLGFYADYSGFDGQSFNVSRDHPDLAQVGVGSLPAGVTSLHFSGRSAADNDGLSIGAHEAERTSQFSTSRHDGNDTIYTGSGEDVVNAGGGHDLVDSGADDDAVEGYSGNDTLYLGSGNDLAYGDGVSRGQRSDDVSLFGVTTVRWSLAGGLHGNDFIDAGVGNDIIYGGGRADMLLGGEGDDAIYGDDNGLAGEFHGDDYIEGGTGADRIDAGGGHDGVFGGDGNDQIHGDTSDEPLDAQWHGNDVISAGAGNDTVLADGGDDEVHGGEGDDWLAGESQTTVGAASTLQGDDRLFGDAGNDTLVGGNGRDLLDGGAGEDYLYGGAADDTLLAGADNDYLDGGDGADVLDGGAGNDRLLGGAGNDTFLVSRDAGVDLVEDSGGIDRVRVAGVNPQDVALSANGGVLTLSAGGAPVVRINGYFTAGGGGSIETIEFDDGTVWTPAIVHERLDIPQVEPELGITNTAIGDGAAQQWQGSAEGDLMAGLEGDDVLMGGAGDDVLAGGAHDDRLFGDEGNDRLTGGAGSDRLVGGAGNDIYTVRRGDGGTIISDGLDAMASNDPSTADAGTDTLRLEALRTDIQFRLELTDPGSGAAVENLYIDWLDGSASVTLRDFGRTQLGGLPVDRVEFLDGSSQTLQELVDSLRTPATGGVDFLYGTSLGDRIDGGGGVDWIEGRGGDDTLLGGSGPNDPTSDPDDTIYGQAGNDTLDGGTGNDILDGGHGNDVFLFGAGSGHDTVVSDPYAWSDRATTTDVVRLLPGIAPQDVTVRWDPANSKWLLLTLAATGDTLRFTIRQEGRHEGDIDAVQFADGTTWTEAQLLQLANQPTAGDDLLLGTPHADSLDGGAGDDRIEGRAGDDTIRGGAGNDLIDPGQGADTFEFARGDGQDVYTGYELLTEGVGADRLQFAAGIAAADVRLWRSGVDGQHGMYITIDGTNDRLAFEALLQHPEGLAEVAFADGTRWSGDALYNRWHGVMGTADGEALNALPGGGAMRGEGGDDQLHGSGFADEIDGGAGRDTMAGGAGDDTYIVDQSADVVTEGAGEGDDAVQSSASYTLSAEVERLLLTGSAHVNGTGNASANVLTGNAGNNTLDGKAGADTMAGGAGDDVYTVDNAGDTVIEGAGEGTDRVNSSVSFALGANIENLTLTGTSSLNGTGNELANSLTGNSGANRLDGGAGVDTLAGGSGNDTYVVDNTADVVNESASAGTDTVESSATFTLGTSVEHLTLTGTTAVNGTGNTAANTLRGNAAANVLDGKGGTDTMIGGAGDDTYIVDVSTDVTTENAGEGTDTVHSAVTRTLGNHLENLTLTGTAAINGTGNTLDNLLVGNSANNTLAGLAGNDIYVGGLGNDTLNDNSTTSNDVYRFGRGDGQDTLTDAGGSADRIEIGAGVSSSQLTQTRSGNNLVLGISGTTDTLTIVNWYASTANRIEEIRLTDGGTVTPAAAGGLTTVKFGADAPTRTLAWRGVSPETNRQAALLIESMAQFAAPAAAEASDLAQPIKQPLPMVAASEWWLSK